jgi:hypothetical protein
MLWQYHFHLADHDNICRAKVEDMFAEMAICHIIVPSTMADKQPSGRPSGLSPIRSGKRAE